MARVVVGRSRRTATPSLFPEGLSLEHFWQRRFYDFNVFTRRKLVERLRYMHRNPVKRGPVEKPEQWRWSSYRHYAFGEPGIVAVNADYGITARKAAR